MQEGSAYFYVLFPKTFIFLRIVPFWDEIRMQINQIAMNYDKGIIYFSVL